MTHLKKLKKNICILLGFVFQELKNLGFVFQGNGYPNWFVNNVINDFDKRCDDPPEKIEKEYLYTIGVPYFGRASRQFAKRLINLVKIKFAVDINVYYTTFKTGSYF